MSSNEVNEVTEKLSQYSISEPSQNQNFRSYPVYSNLLKSVSLQTTPVFQRNPPTLVSLQSTSIFQVKPLNSMSLQTIPIFQKDSINSVPAETSPIIFRNSSVNSVLVQTYPDDQSSSDDNDPKSEIIERLKVQYNEIMKEVDRYHEIDKKIIDKSRKNEHILKYLIDHEYAPQFYYV